MLVVKVGSDARTVSPYLFQARGKLWRRSVNDSLNGNYTTGGNAAFFGIRPHRSRVNTRSRFISAQFERG
jgi:hypothetical protein